MPWGRIVKALSGYYYVLPDDKNFSSSHIIQCRARGLFRKQGITPLVGDHVLFEYSNDVEGTVVEVGPRKNELRRPAITNVDLAILVFSLDQPQFSYELLDRFLIQIEMVGIPAVICLTKSDLIQDDHFIHKIKDVYERIGYEVVVTNIEEEGGLQQLIDLLQGSTSVFAGQSGVGKSTLLNRLFPEYNLKTAEISQRLGRGRHTTRHVELLPFDDDSWVADTPGFSQLDFFEMEPEDLSHYFKEMAERLSNCRFRGCVHAKEPGCAIRSAVEEGEISETRYQNYLSFLAEVEEAKQRRY